MVRSVEEQVAPAVFSDDFAVRAVDTGWVPGAPGIDSLHNPGDRSPVVAQPIADQTIAEDNAWTFQLPAGTFSDPDNDTLSFSATLADGSALPAWLGFNASTETFSGRPPLNFFGTIDLKITASDGTLDTNDDFILNVTPVNDAPVLALPLLDRDTVQNIRFMYRVPDGTFTDADSNLAYTATLADGSALPDWLSFDPVTQTFLGKVPASALGTYDILVTASDGAASASDVFALHVKASNMDPVANPIANQTIQEDQPWSFTVAAGTFTDADSADLAFIGYGPKHQGLPSWIHFDPLTQTFSGTPPKDFNGSMKLWVSADDGEEQVSTSFKLTILPVEDAPLIAQALQDRTALEDAAFTFAIPDGSFVDPDGDAVSYSATLENGSALPAWLAFDPATLNFVGTPPQDFNGILSVKVTASDGTLSTSDVFLLKVLPVDDAPIVATPTDPVHITAGQTFSFTVPESTFTDVDSATLTLSAKLANGLVLPRWISFDAATGTFSGAVPDWFSGPLTIALTASDGVASVSEILNFSDTAPVLSHPILDQTIGDGRSWQYAVPTGTFVDFDTDQLIYSATLADGTRLPAWLKFDAATQTFTGTPPEGWNGHEDLKVIASDGIHSAGDSFALDQKGDFSYKIHASMWGRNAPSEIHYRFDKLFFESHHTYSTGFAADASSGPFDMNVSGSASISYAVQAGLLIDFTLKPDTIDLNESFDVHETLSTAADAIGKNPFVIVTGEIEDTTNFNLTVPDDEFLLHAFAGVTASVAASLSGGFGGTYHTPYDFPNISLGASLGVNVSLPVIQAITVGDGKITKPDGNIGAIDVNIKTGDDPFQFDLDKSGIGHITIGPPKGISATGFDIENVGANGLGTFHAGGTTDPILSAQLDLDQLAIKAVPELKALFHDELQYSFGPFYLGANLNTDLALVGDISLKEEVFFTPQIYYTMTTSYGQTLTGQAGDKTSFDTPEGEGNLTVHATYTSQADLTTVISLVGNIYFDMTLLKATLVAGLHIDFIVDSINYTFADFDLPPAYQTSLSLVGITIPIFSNTDHYTLDQTRKDTFQVAYEKFRTTEGSGDNWTLTTHQIYAFGNDHSNHFIGNGLDDLLIGAGGDDTLEAGSGGAVEMTGDDGNDVLKGGAGNDYMDGGAGNDTISSGDGGSTILGGDGNDTIKTGKGDDNITDLTGVVNITDAGGNNTITVGDQGVTLKLTKGNNIITAGAGDDKIATGVGTDVINSGAGNDQISAGDGFNAINAGAGNDSITSGNDGSIIDGGDGNDVIRTGKGDDVITDLTGTVDILDTGGNNTITLGNVGYSLKLTAGNNVINTGSGDDKIITGAGNDNIHAFDGNNVINAGDGDNVAIGGAGIDSITTGSGNDFIKGYAGNDKIVAGDGNNTVFGYEGDDSITAGSGNDQIYGDAGNDVINAGDGNNYYLSGGDGNDVVTSGLGADYLTGDAGDDRLSAGGGNDILLGGDGADTLIGGAGDDSLQGDADFGSTSGSQVDTFVFMQGSGNDTILNFDLNYVPGGNLLFQDVIDLSNYYSITSLNGVQVGSDGSGQLKLILSPTDSVIFAGFYTDLGDPRAVLSQFKFLLFDPSKKNIMTGSDGDDTLDGGADADKMSGLMGNDTYKVDNVNDKVFEKDKEGTDTIIAKVSYVLAAHQSVEIIQADSPTGDINFTGNELANKLLGNDGINVLDGGDGNDTLSGGKGNDTLLGGNGNDQLTGGAGFDMLTGGGDADSFRFLNIADSSLATPDQITDFLSGVDKIDLSAIDADTTVSGDQAFTLVMGNHADKGQIAAYLSGGTLVLDINNDNDAQIEMRIVLLNHPAITTTDFIL